MPDEDLFATLRESLRQTRTTRARRAARLAEIELEADRLRVEISELDELEGRTRQSWRRLMDSEIGVEPLVSTPTDRDIEAALQHDAARERAAFNPPPNPYNAPAYPNQFNEQYAGEGGYARTASPPIEKIPRVENPPLRSDVEPTSDRFFDRTIPQATAMILREEGRALHVNELYNRLLDGGFNFTGQNPTISIAVSLNRNRRFRKVAPGTFDLTIRDVAQVS
ncbi:MAG: winged helix-turn-helix domain-containing protein [Pyrinomonadaceae bacterium MAG19_C2-C3]|nr:winged helix-turn-helix domain-containing protein [Pyrinomonadaceae bacterium MAG19_C2-C3]